jgi:hypothetical protein
VVLLTVGAVYDRAFLLMANAILEYFLANTSFKNWAGWEEMGTPFVSILVDNKAAEEGYGRTDH